MHIRIYLIEDSYWNGVEINGIFYRLNKIGNRGDCIRVDRGPFPNLAL